MLLIFILFVNYSQAIECQIGLREDNTNYIYCARQQLDEIPKFNVNQSIVVYDELVLSENQIKILKSIDIKVKKLYLDQNPIEYIQQRAINSLKSYLEEVYFEYPNKINPFDTQDDKINDNLSVFETNIFTQCTNLRILSIKNYKKTHLVANSFKKLTKLNVLTLQNAQISTIEEEAFNGLDQSLIELNLDSNELQSIPIKSIEKLKNLKKLSLSQNRIKSFEYLRLSNLISLNLAFNSLKSINNKPSLDVKLTQINLQNNELQFQHFLMILSELSTLEELNMDYNKLYKIDNIEKSIVSSASLKLLSIQGNQLGQDGLEKLSKYMFYKLEKLNLARNKINVFSIGTSMPVLKNLILDKNSLNGFLLENLENSLQELSLSNTGLEEIDLSKMNVLQKLKLNGNKIKRLNIGQIDSIDLQNNGLSQIPESICDSLTIKELDLSFNNIKQIPLKCLKESLKGINLNNNPLKCNCENKHLRDWIDVNIQKDLIEFIKWECEEPILMRHRLFTNFNTQTCYPQKQIESTTTTRETQTLKFTDQEISQKQIDSSVILNNTSVYYVTIAFILGCTILSISLIIIIYSLSIKNLKVKHAISKMTMIQTEDSSGIFSDRTLSTQSSVSTRHYYHDFNTWYSQSDLTETKKQQHQEKQIPYYISHLYDEIIANNLFFNPVVNTQETITPQAISININQGSLFI